MTVSEIVEQFLLGRLITVTEHVIVYRYRSAKNIFGIETLRNARGYADWFLEPWNIFRDEKVLKIYIYTIV